MRKVTDSIGREYLNYDVVQAFDRFLTEVCADRGIFGSGLKDVDVSLFFGEEYKHYTLSALIVFNDASNSTDEVVCVWNEFYGWLTIDATLEDD